MLWWNAHTVNANYSRDVDYKFELFKAVSTSISVMQSQPDQILVEQNYGHPITPKCPFLINIYGKPTVNVYHEIKPDRVSELLG